VRRDGPRDESGRKDPRAGRLLALVPVGVALVLAGFLLPRRVVPEDIPLPELDDRIISREVRADTERAARAHVVPLAADVRALGSAIRAFNTAEASDERDVVLTDARAAIDRARLDLIGHGRDSELLGLRAVQMTEFLTEVRRFEATGRRSSELDALAGTFIPRMRRVGWCDGNNVLLNDLERRAAFKATWNTLVVLDKDPAFALSDQENRALYRLYFAHPHASEPQRAALAIARSQARDAATCARIDDGERVAIQSWLVPKLAEYASLDPSYPIAIARGVVFYKRHQYGEAAHSFSQWLEQHPNGPWTLRARNYLKASTLAAEETY
jgi:TolA-binding protein